MSIAAFVFAAVSGTLAVSVKSVFASIAALNGALGPKGTVPAEGTYENNRREH